MNLLASRTMLVALAAANVVLLAAVALTSSRDAQAFGGGGNYTMVVGQSTGLSQETLYIVDTDSGRAASVSYNPSSRKFETCGVRDFSKDLNEGEKAGGRPNAR